MPRIRRSKTNGTTFEDIPKEKEVGKGSVFYGSLIIEKNRLVIAKQAERTELVRERAEIRKQMYNLTKEMNEAQAEIANLLERYDVARKEEMNNG